MDREQDVVRSLREVVRQNIERHRIDLVRGLASFEDPQTVRVTPRDGGPDSLLGAEVVLIATGSLPSRSRDIPFAEGRIYDSDEIIRMRRGGRGQGHLRGAGR